jgi:hypothetical protein
LDNSYWDNWTKEEKDYYSNSERFPILNNKTRDESTTTEPGENATCTEEGVRSPKHHLSLSKNWILFVII